MLDARGLSDERMLAIAAEVGYSESAFLLGGDGPDATSATSARSPRSRSAGMRPSPPPSRSPSARGPATSCSDPQRPVPVTSRRDEQGRLTATLTSVTPRVDEVARADLDEVLAALGWEHEQLDPALPPRVGFAGVTI